jgi:thiol-disulfide isomerase/thioredoxin
MTPVRAAVVVELLAGLLSGCGSATPQATSSDRLPDVTLRPLDKGSSVRLSELRGPMVVNLWASWCTPCRKEMPLYQAFARRHAKGVKVLGIDFQDTRADAARALARRSGVTYPLLADPSGRLHAVGLPKLILLDRKGRIAHQEYVEITSVGQLERIVSRHLGRAVLERSAA